MPEPAAPAPPRLGWGTRLLLAAVLAVGPAYLLWMTGIEGRRVWVVGGLVALIAGCAAVAHYLIGLARPATRRDDPAPKLHAGSDKGPQENPELRVPRAGGKNRS